MVNLPEAILSTRQVGAEMGTGTVVSVSTTTLGVLIRGASLESAYLESYGAPVAGDLVAFIRQDSTILVLGPLAGVGANAIVNFSFEDDGVTNITPSGWVLFNISGAGTARATNTGYAPAGQFELAVNSGAVAQDTYVYSTAIPVSPGQTWAVSALTSGVYPVPNLLNANAALYGLWFANSTNLYPVTTSADTLIAQVNGIAAAPTHVPVSGTVTVPGGASYMRIATRSISPASETVLWDVVIARRLT